MRSIFEFFKQKWVVHLLGIIALSVLIWVLGPWIAFGDTESIKRPLESPFSRLVGILILVTVWALNNLRHRAVANRADRDMMAELTGHQVDVEPISEPAEDEIGVLSENFDESLEILKKSFSKGRHDKQYLYEIPWYIIIGPPGSGKTTALFNSGLEFPLAERFGTKEFKGSGGTRNCDWLFTNEAVLLDTAGRYTTQDSNQTVDQAEWQGFLKLLKKHRPRRPINGVLVTMSISDLLLQTEEERRVHGRDICERIQELYEHLGVRIPIYMLFTKCDLVSGFNDFFADLGRNDRAQVWGETFPEESKEEPLDVVGRFGSAFDTLIQRLEQRVLKRVQDERDMTRRGLVFPFPQQMALLREPMLEYLQLAFGETRFQTAPVLLRGVYLTSATQEGTPIDRVMGVLADAFSLDGRSLNESGGSGRSYFIGRLLKEVIFPEAGLTGVDSRIEKRRVWLQRGAYACAAFVVLGLILLWTISLTRNQNAMAEQQAHIDQYKIVDKSTPDWHSGAKSLLPRLNAAYASREVFPENTPWMMGFGLYQGDKLRSAADDAYGRLLENSLLPVIKLRLEQRLQQTDPANTDDLFQLLKVYLMLGDPKQMEPDLAHPLISVDWARLYGDDDDVQRALLIHLRNLLAMGFRPQPLDEVLIRNTRKVLARTPIAEQVYARLKTKVMGDDSLDFRVYRALGRFGDRVFESSGEPLIQLKIAGLYTDQGFHQIFQKESLRLSKEIMEQRGILGGNKRATAKEISQLQEELKSLYFADYIRNWSGLLDKINIKPTQNINQTLDVLEYISIAESPLKGLLLAVNRNTSLIRSETAVGKVLDTVKEGSEKADDGWIDKLLSTVGQKKGIANQLEPGDLQVDRYFGPLNFQVRGEPPPIDGIISKLAEIHEDLKILQNLSGSDELLKTTAERMAGGGGGNIGILQTESMHAPEPLSRWLRSLTQQSWKVVLSDVKNQLNTKWQTEVVSHYREGLDDRYPLFKESSKDATLTDFSNFFQPGGVIDSFFNDNLMAFVETGKPQWTAREIDNQSIGISNAALQQFQYAAKIRDIFFRGGASPSVQFQLKPITLDSNVKSFTLFLDGQENHYAHGPTIPKSYRWPTPDGTGQVRIVFQSLNGQSSYTNKEGLWAWFKILDESNMEATQLADRFRITFQLKGLKMRYELHAESVVNPFKLSALENFRCPLGL